MQLSVKDTSIIFAVSENSVYQWIKQKNIPVYQINGQFRFNRTELLEWSISKGIRICSDIFKKPCNKEIIFPDLCDVIRTCQITQKTGESDPASILHSVVEMQALSDKIDKEFLYQTLLPRKTYGFKSAGDGIAIPNVRNPWIFPVSGAKMTICFLEYPMNFKTYDNKPIDVLFTLVSPSVRMHLHLLSRLGYALQENDFRAAVLSRASESEILTALELAESKLNHYDNNDPGENVKKTWP